MIELIIGVLVVTLGMVIVAIVHIAYRHGVRDGYQNNHLPHIRKQIRDEGLEQYWTDTSDWKDKED